ncbi:hypothetical protein DFH09DRAFT_1342499 [Mycena vulgaris]|nr:hypothetical protein DFH09DRAFT_1342499 [Mycena vulgaris]
MPFLGDDDADHEAHKRLRPGAPSTAQRVLSLPPSSPPAPFTGPCPLVLYRHLSDCPPAPRKFEKASEELGGLALGLIGFLKLLTNLPTICNNVCHNQLILQTIDIQDLVSRISYYPAFDYIEGRPSAHIQRFAKRDVGPWSYRDDPGDEEQASRADRNRECRTVISDGGVAYVCWSPLRASSRVNIEHALRPAMKARLAALDAQTVQQGLVEIH